MVGLLGLAVIPGCRLKPKAKPVTVRIFRDLSSPYGNQLDHRILEFQQRNPHTPSGAPIRVESFNVPNYESFLRDHVDQDTTPEVVILDSPKDASTNPKVQAELGKAVNICAAVKACPDEVPAFVPTTITGLRAEAANQFLAFLLKQPA